MVVLKHAHKSPGTSPLRGVVYILSSWILLTSWPEGGRNTLCGFQSWVLEGDSPTPSALEYTHASPRSNLGALSPCCEEAPVAHAELLRLPKDRELPCQPPGAPAPWPSLSFIPATATDQLQRDSKWEPPSQALPLFLTYKNPEINEMSATATWHLSFVVICYMQQ